MTSHQMLLLNHNKRAFADRNTNYSNKKSGKNGNTDGVLEDEHERFVKYIPMDYEQGKMPVTDDEWRAHIKKSFGKKTDLNFLKENVHDSAYDNLIADLQAGEQYNQQLAEQKRWIKINRKNKQGYNKQRSGIPINKKTYYIVIKARKDKSGKRVSAYRRYYSTNTGKQISGGKLSRYVDLTSIGTIELNRIERIKHMKKHDKEKSSFQKFSQKKKAEQRIKRLRGKK